MIDKTENIIWASVADGSWGGCERGDLIIVRESDLTDEERTFINNAFEVDNDLAACDALSAAEARIHRDTCLCPKGTYKGEG
jgi:hypothetical protein